MSKPKLRGLTSRRFVELWQEPEAAQRMREGAKAATKALKARHPFDKAVASFRSARARRKISTA